jgi:hypothetical protein
VVEDAPDAATGEELRRLLSQLREMAEDGPIERVYASRLVVGDVMRERSPTYELTKNILAYLEFRVAELDPGHMRLRKVKGCKAAGVGLRLWEKTRLERGSQHCGQGYCAY